MGTNNNECTNDNEKPTKRMHRPTLYGGDGEPPHVAAEPAWEVDAGNWYNTASRKKAGGKRQKLYRKQLGCQSGTIEQLAQDREVSLAHFLQNLLISLRQCSFHDGNELQCVP